jgi:hypothetical protein
VSRLPSLLGAGALLVSVLAGACAIHGSVLAESIETRTIRTTVAPQINVETFNGRITLTAGGEDTVELRVVRRGSGPDQAAADADLAKVELTVDEGPGRVTIIVRRTDRPLRTGESGADIELSVPPASSLELRSSNGRIESSNVGGSIVARTSNGAVTIRGGEDIDAETTNAPMTVSAASGELDLRTSNGALDIVAATEARVTARTINGNLSFSGALGPGEHLFRTANAGLTLTLPPDAQFEIRAVTSNAAVRTDFVGLTVEEAGLEGTVGEMPYATILAETSNGVVSVLQGR